MEEIIPYILDTYRPEAVILYGSFANGTNNAHSDFDALVIAPGEKRHDASVVAGITLDVFIYPRETFQGDYDPADYVQVCDGTVILDRTGAAEALIRRVRTYLDSLPVKTPEEKRQALDWCRKMLRRTARGDPEGFYRWHWLLCDSLEICFDLRERRYPGPKKALKAMEEEDPEGFRLYSAALGAFSEASLAAWVGYLETLT